MGHALLCVHCVCAFTCIFIHRSGCRCQRSTSGSFLSSFSSCFLRHALSLALGVSSLAKLASQQAPGIHLSLQPQCWDCKHTPPHTTLKWLLGLELSSSCLHGQYLLTEPPLQSLCSWDIQTRKENVKCELEVVVRNEKQMSATRVNYNSWAVALGRLPRLSVLYFLSYKVNSVTAPVSRGRARVTRAGGVLDVRYLGLSAWLRIRTQECLCGCHHRQYNWPHL